MLNDVETLEKLIKASATAINADYYSTTEINAAL